MRRPAAAAGEEATRPPKARAARPREGRLGARLPCGLTPASSVPQQGRAGRGHRAEGPGAGVLPRAHSARSALLSELVRWPLSRPCSRLESLALCFEQGGSSLGLREALGVGRPSGVREVSWPLPAHRPPVRVRLRAARQPAVPHLPGPGGSDPSSGAPSAGPEPSWSPSARGAFLGPPDLAKTQVRLEKLGQEALAARQGHLGTRAGKGRADQRWLAAPPGSPLRVSALPTSLMGILESPGGGRGARALSSGPSMSRRDLVSGHRASQAGGRRVYESLTLSGERMWGGKRGGGCDCV